MFEDAFHIEIRPIGLKDKAAQQYCEDVRLQLGQVLTTDTGNALLTALGKNTYWTSIEPYTGNHGTCNAWTTPVKDQLVNKRRFRSRVEYTGSETCNKDFAGLPHEYLHHELVHAFRQTLDLWMPIGLPKGMEHYQDYEEFYAVLLTNILISDESNTFKSKLRGAYTVQRELAPEFADSLGFYRSSPYAFPIIDNFCSKHREYTKSLVRVKGAFNPIAAMYTDRKKAEENSQAAEAKAAKAS